MVYFYTYSSFLKGFTLRINITNDKKQFLQKKRKNNDVCIHWFYNIILIIFIIQDNYKDYMYKFMVNTFAIFYHYFDL